MNRPGVVHFRVIEDSWRQARVWGFLLFGALGILLTAEKGFSWESKLLGSVSLKEEYNDNIFLDVYGSRQSDFITTFSPRLEWAERSERLDFNINGQLNALNYLRYHEYDALDYNSQASLQYRLSERAEVSAAGGFLRDSRPDRDLLATGLVLGTVPRDRWFYNLSGKYTLSEKDGAEVSYNQIRDTFHDPRYSDSDVKNASILFTRTLGDTLRLWKARAQFSFGDYSFLNVNSETKDYAVTVGAARDLSEGWSIVADLGGRYTASRFTVTEIQFIPPFFLVLVPEQMETSGWGWIGALTLTYRDASSGGEIGFRQDIAPASGVSVTQRTALHLSMYHRITSELQATFSAEYYLNKAEKSQYSLNEINFQTFNIGPGLRYEYSQELAIDLSYAFTRVENMVANTIGDRNLFMIRLTIQEDLLDALHGFHRWMEKQREKP